MANMSLAVLRLTARERLHTARAAEHVMNDVLVELIVADRVQTAQQLELPGFTKVSHRPCLEQIEQLQAIGLGGIGGRLVAHPTAVAAA